MSLAKQQVGKPYIWGGVGPDNYDCSGLVQYVYGHAAGVNMPRVTADQVRVGQTVPMDQLKPGDLIYWGSATSPYQCRNARPRCCFAKTYNILLSNNC